MEDDKKRSHANRGKTWGWPCMHGYLQDGRRELATKPLVALTFDEVTVSGASTMNLGILHQVANTFVWAPSQDRLINWLGKSLNSIL